jgi:WD40 repeat protein
MVAQDGNPTPTPAVPPVVADHELLRRIGVGAYGEVWLARSVMGMPRAVKVLRRDQFEHERIYEREFTGLQHFEPVSRSHPGVVNILHVGRSETHGCFYYVMELADPADPTEGWVPDRYVPLTLSEVLRRRGALPVTECARIGAAVADALAFLHGRGLVHRDVKPSNIILVGGQPKLADIGLVAGLNAARSFVGTQGYIPPEGPGSSRSDLFSLGMVLYEMSTGRNRLDFPDLPPDWQSGPEPEQFAELNETILRACASSASDRHASAEELRNELLLVEAGRSVRRLRRTERILTRWRRFAAVAAVLALTSLGAIWFAHKQAMRAEVRAEHEAALRQRIEAQELMTRQTLYAADMNLVQQAIVAGNFGRAEELLAAYWPTDGQSDLRGFEWYHYWERVRGDTLGVLRGHEQLVTALALSRDGRRLYSASFDGTLREWSLDTFREQHQWSWPGSLLLGLAWDPRGHRLVVAMDNPPRWARFDVGTATWREFASSGAPTIVLSPEGDRLLRGNRIVLFETDAVTEIVNVERGDLERVLNESGGRAWFVPGGNRLMTGPWGNTLRLWSWPALELLGELPDTGTVMDVSFAPDGSRMVSGSRQGRLQLWDLQARVRRADRSAHEASVIWSVAYSPDGRWLASAGNDQTVRLWDAEAFEERHVFRGHGSEVWALAWTSDGRQLISAGKDATIRLWDAEPDVACFERLDVAQAPVFSPDDRLVAVRLAPSGLVVLEPATGREQLALDGVIELGGFSEDGSTLSLLRAGGTVELRAVEDGGLIGGYPTAATGIASTVRLLSGSGRWLVVGTEDGTIWVYDVFTGGSPRHFAGHNQRIFSLEISPDERWLLSGSRDLTARRWDLETGEEKGVFTGHRMSVSALAFAPDQTTIATGSWDDTVRIYDTSTGLELAVYGAHSASVHDVGFAPDHRTLAVMSGAGELRFWNLATHREAGQFQLDRGTGLGRLRFSPQGNWLAAVSPAGRLTLLAAPRPNVENRSQPR